MTNYLNQDACLTPYERFMKKYEEKHKYCPDCGGDDYCSTLVARVLDLNNTHLFEDENTCRCSCGSVHKMHDRVPFKNENI